MSKRMTAGLLALTIGLGTGGWASAQAHQTAMAAEQAERRARIDVDVATWHADTEFLDTRAEVVAAEGLREARAARAERERLVQEAAAAAEAARQAEASRLAAEAAAAAAAAQAEVEAAAEAEAARQAVVQSEEDAQQQASVPAAPATSYRDRVAGLLATYGCAGASFIIDSPRLGAGAATDMSSGQIYVTSGITSRLTYVVAHECVHLRQLQVYGYDTASLQADMNAIYGGSGMGGLEQNADCVTQRWGIAQWNYTSLCGGARGDAAAAIAGRYRP